MIPDSAPIWVALIVMTGAVAMQFIAAVSGRPLRLGAGKFAIIFGTRRSQPGSNTQPTPGPPAPKGSGG